MYKVDMLLNCKERRKNVIYFMLMGMQERRQQEKISGIYFCLFSEAKTFMNINYIARLQAFRRGVNKIFKRSRLKITGL
jgi:hypothetical protein